MGPRDHPPITTDISLAILLHKTPQPLNENEFPPLKNLSASLEGTANEKAGTAPTDQTASEDIEKVAADAREEANETVEKDEEAEESPEQLLYRCFLAALIHRLTKHAQFPFDVGQFYSRCLLPCVPEGRRLDMKKTKYKKFSAFLAEVGQNAPADAWLVRIVQKAKGIDVITEVNWAQPDLKRFVLKDERITDEDDSSNAAASTASCVPQIVEGYSVTEPVLAVLKAVDSSICKGDYLDLQATRTLITEYIKSRVSNFCVSFIDLLRKIVEFQVCNCAISG